MNFFRDHINKILLTLVTAGLIAAMALSAVGKPNAGLAMDTFGFVMKPIQSFFAYIGDCFSYGADSEKYAQENSRLKQELIIANKHAISALLPIFVNCDKIPVNGGEIYEQKATRKSQCDL